MKRILAMKMDIEGSEGNALKGASKLLSEVPPCYMQIELNSVLLQKVSGISIDELLALLEDAGYDTKGVGSGATGDHFLKQRDMQACVERLRAIPP